MIDVDFMASKTTSKRTVQRKSGPYKKAPRKRKSLTRRGFQANLPQLAREELARLRMPGLSIPNRTWFNWSGRHWSKLASMGMMVFALTGLLWVHMDYRWFVYADSVEFTNLSYLTVDELYPATELEGWSVFWVLPEQVREQLLAHPYVADVDVRVRLPNKVTIEVDEERPTAIWMTDIGPMWVLPDGSALKVRTAPDQPIEAQLLDEDGRRLPTIVDVQQAAVSVRAKDLAMDPDVLESALVLMEELPELDIVRYNKGIGLNFALPNSDYWIYWGDGLDLESKLENLTLSRELLDSGQLVGQIVDVRFRDHPIIR